MTVSFVDNTLDPSLQVVCIHMPNLLDILQCSDLNGLSLQYMYR